MTLFIIICVLITALVIAALVWPLLKTRNTYSYERQAQNIHFAKERLQELEDQLKNAAISPTDYEALKLEIESTLAQDIDLAESKTNKRDVGAKASNGVLIALLCGLVPFASLVVYQLIGTPSALNLKALDNTAVAAEQTAAPAAEAQNTLMPSEEEINKMIKQVETRLQGNPNDVEGWAILSRTYQAVGRFDDSIEASKKLLELNGENPNVYAAMADVSALKAGGVLAGQPSQYVQKALSINPDHPQSLWLAGLAAAQGGDNKIARDYWNRLMPLLADSPQQQLELREIIKESETNGGQILLGANQAAAGNNSAAAGNKPSAAGSDNSNTETQPTQAAPESTDKAASNGITVNVRLDDAVANQVQASDLVFVFARAQKGPPAPLAVKRMRVSDLPATIQLSDGDAMMPALKLSLFEDVIVSARVAKAGNPVAQAGDIQSAKITTKNNTSDPLELVISEVIQ